MNTSVDLFRKALAALSLLVLIGCTTHSSPRQSPTGGQFLFVSDNEMAFFGAAYDAMSEARPELPIFDIDGPVRGYQMTRVFVLDRYTTVTRVFRAEGEDANGNTISGYYPEVSGSGTMIISGPATDDEVYRLALKKFEAVGTRKPVNELRRISYAVERDRWRLNSQPSLREDGTINLTMPDRVPNNNQSVSKRIEELESLRANGKVTNEEFERLKAKILEDL